jgi:exopolysaccharide biosynthesis polyprenyl glycosylphosphotransferase
MYATLALVSDSMAAGVAAALAFGVAVSVGSGPTTTYLVESLLFPVLWVAAIAAAGGYDRRFLGNGPEELRSVALGCFGLGSVIGFVSWATQAEVARSYVLVALPTAGILTWVGRYAIRKWVHAQRGQGRFQHSTIIVGSSQGVSDLARRLASKPHHGYEVLGACVPSSSLQEGFADVPVLGTMDMICDVVRDTGADTVAVVSSPDMDGDVLRRLSWDLEPTGANLVVAPALVEVAGPRLAVRPVDGLPLLHVEHPRFSGIRYVLKSVIDPLIAGLALVLLSPVLLAIGLLIKLDSPGPALFRQVRVGRLGEQFTIFKFRTMVADAEARKQEIAHLNESDGPLFKTRRDPRVTRLGAFLRRTSLDELPQLLNVVLGSMAIVGPRPHLPEEVALFGAEFSRRLFVKPGLTGLWQVSGRSDLSYEESVRLDLRYVENWTLAMDLFIIWKTLGVVLRGSKSGAY